MSLVYLDELCDSISETLDKNTENVVLINTSDVYGGKVLNHEFVPNKNIKGQFKKLFRKNDILYSEIRPANKHYAFVDFESYNYVASTKLMVLRPKIDIVLPKFLYYILKNKNVVNFLQGLAESRSGTFPQITFSELSTIDINLPSLEEQDVIVNIINNIESKIENLENINKHLNKLLMSIFISWFIKFENYDGTNGMKHDDSYGKVPKPWSVEMLEDYVDFVTGVEPGSKNYHDKPGVNDIPFLRVGDLGSRDNAVFIDESLSKNKILEYDDIVLSLDATIGIVKMGLEGAYSTGMRKLVIKNDGINKPFLYCLVKSDRIQRIIETFATGTTILHAGKSIKHMNFVLSDKQTMDKFGEIGNPILSTILANLKEIKNLQKLRDTLLPKLMSGEIDVSKLNCDLIITSHYLSVRFPVIQHLFIKSYNLTSRLIDTAINI